MSFFSFLYPVTSFFGVQRLTSVAFPDFFCMKLSCSLSWGNSNPRTLCGAAIFEPVSLTVSQQLVQKPPRPRECDEDCFCSFPF